MEIFSENSMKVNVNYGSSIPSLTCQVYHHGLVNDLEVVHNAAKKCVDENVAVKFEKDKYNKKIQKHKKNYEYLRSQVDEVFSNEEDHNKRFNVSSIQSIFFLSSDTRLVNGGLVFIADTID